jgi:O-antigen ligase
MRTGSRAGLLGLGFYLVAVFLLASFANKAKLILGGGAVLAVLFATAPESAMDRYRTLWDDEIEEGEAVASARGRGLLLKESIRQTLLHPVFGLGPGNFKVAFARKMESEGHMYHRFRASHNTYTQVSSETGIPGFIMFMSVMVWCFRQNLRLYRQTNRHPQHKEIANMAICLFLSLLVFSVTSFFGSNAYRFYLPVLAGCTVSLKRVADEVLASGAGQRMPARSALWPPPTPRPAMTSRPISLT